MDMKTARFPDLSPARRTQHVLQHVFRNYTGGLRVQLWNGDILTIGTGQAVATIIFRSADIFRELILHRDPLTLAEAYFSGMVDVDGDLFALFSQKEHLSSFKISLKERLSILAAALAIKDTCGTYIDGGRQVRWHRKLSSHLKRKSSRAFNRDAIAFHYDVSNDFYRLWLDQEMVYSCAYFEADSNTLEQAQADKLHHIFRKLRLKPGERLLDVGCGWGALICWAAKHYGVSAHGITLSRQQYEYAQQKIRALGLEDRVSVEMRDYRDLPSEPLYDKVSSVGMFEHVGLRNLPTYFRVVHRVLKPGGLFLNHGITNDREGWRKTVGTEFIQRYVFPDGELDTVSNIQRVMEHASFEIIDVEGMRLHYALTLRHWVARLDARRQEALNHVAESTFRVWRLYMTACALQFEEGGTGIYQILAAKRHGGPIDVPLTRSDLYLPPHGTAREDIVR
ncbi:cyclopropane-fatty-acyl-phospholipid synthase family protein [Herbaspirillum sp. ST 5-3]|uniref:SAM-dependent methyltransferase n=1 Tax=Oxalobacteraceae TaxID=75682 RepID=UPI0010A57C47|nr:cyclopropane-fatty-acyl-phospholipid synthase family protein [Herbaspirillum sp. ST 5-3]